MQIALYGATGRTGSRILHELLSRGHRVIAVKRDGQTPSSPAEVVWATDDLSHVPNIVNVIRGTGAVVSAYSAPSDDSDALVGVCERLAEAVAVSGVPRLLVVGGAGVLQVAPGVTLLDSGKLPAEWVPMAAAHAKALAALKRRSIDWTYISPAAMFEPGERTGRYRTAKDSLLTNEAGESRISMEDYAIAIVDELEKPKHLRASFAVSW